MYQISGIHDITINEDKKTMMVYGYNADMTLATWHKSFGAKADLPCRLDALYFSERGTISQALVHPALPLFLTVSEGTVLVSYEKGKEFTHAGSFVPKEGGVRQNFREAFWLDQLPLFCVMTTEPVITLKVVGPAIQPIAEDIGSYTSMLAYSMNTSTPYIWKPYFTQDLRVLRISPSTLLHIATIYDADHDEYAELVLLFEGKQASLGQIKIGNVLSQDDLDIHLKIKGTANLDPRLDEIGEKYVLKAPTHKRDSFRICIRTKDSIHIYTMSLGKEEDELNCELSGEIQLSEEPQLIRVNNFQMPLIAIMDKSNIVISKSPISGK